MEINPSSIVEYCSRHSTQPSALCDEIAQYTQANVAVPQMLSGPLVGSFLGFLVSLLRPNRVLEIGTYTGYSALCMAERLEAGAGLITLDANTETIQIAKTFWSRSPAGKFIECISGDAKKTLAGLDVVFDLIFIDADKGGYIHYLDRALDLLSSTGVIVADNALYHGEVLDGRTASPNGRALMEFNDYVGRHDRIESVLLPVRDGLQVIRKRRLDFS